MSLNDQFRFGTAPSSALHDLKRKLSGSSAAAATPVQFTVRNPGGIPERVGMFSAADAEKAMHLQNGDPLKSGAPPQRSPDTFLVAVDGILLDSGASDFFHFVGPDEKVDLTQWSEFVTLTPAELEAILGHAPILNQNKVPALSESETKVMCAAIAVRIKVIDNKAIRLSDKRRILDEAGFANAAKIVKTEFIEGGSEYVRFSGDDERHIDLPEHAVDSLLGRPIASTQGKIITDDEAEFLGVAVAAYERLKLPPSGQTGSSAVRYARAKFGETQARRLGEFLKAACIQMAEANGILIDNFNLQLAALREMQDWVRSCNAVFTLERPQGSQFHSLVAALRDRTVLAISTSRKQPEALVNAFDDITQPFVVEHDWAQAFAGSGDFDSGEFSLPYERSVWEFQVSGRRVALAVSPSMLVLFISTKAGWVCFSAYHFSMMGAGSCHAVHEDETHDAEFVAVLKAYQPLVERLLRNVRAVAISLEAEIAQKDVVRADYKLNQAREKRGRLPLYDYHVVSLVHRSRVAALPHPLDPNRDIVRRRCHFRRGHWRHFENHKTWIKWMLVGDPDLGFVEKHYRL